MVEELKILGAGVDNVYNSYLETYFTLRAYIIIVSGDGPASAEAIGLKNPGNAIRPCHQCMIEATRGPTGNTYYIPHLGIDLRNIPLRTNLREILCKWDSIENKALKELKGKDLGITRKSILLQLPSLRFPESFPLDLMHCVLQNITPMIHTLMGGRVDSDDQTSNKGKAQYRKRVAKDLGEEAAAQIDLSQAASLPNLSCVISAKEWSNIGNWQENSRKMIPTALGQGPRPINTRVRGYKAKEWEAWLVRDGLTLMGHLGE